MRLRPWIGAFLLPVLPLPVAASPRSGAPASPCSTPAFHAFDFWAGDWDAYNAADNSLDGHVRVTRVLGGCALREEYHSADGGGGESLSAWDAAHEVWRQNWVSSRGSLVSIEGNFRNGAMILSGPESGTHAPDLVRGTWTPEPGGVRELGERSTDGGRTWQPWFDLHFRPARAVSGLR